MSPASSSGNRQTDALLAQPDVKRILAALSMAGEEVRVVGGAVRDAVMGRPVGDIDIATTALPDHVMRVAAQSGWKAVPTGLEHGTVTLVLNGTPYEVTTLRRDVETDGRRATVAFTRDFREDAFRRDFTINALSLSADGKVHDYATGLADAAAGRVRFMGDAGTRIREDYLRVLRFFRFFASHGKGTPDATGFEACRKHKTGMAQLSRERIRQELLKLLVAARASDAVRAMDQIGLWPIVLRGGPPAISDLNAVIRIETELERAPDTILRLAALGGEQDGLQEDLKLSNHDAERIVLANRHIAEMSNVTIPRHAIKSLIFRAGYQGFQDALMLASARTGLSADIIQVRLVAAKPFVEEPPVNPFRSSALSEHGVKPGPRMGAILKTALELWLERGLPELRDIQSNILAEAIAQHPD